MMLGLGEDVYDPYTGSWIGTSAPAAPAAVAQLPTTSYAGLWDTLLKGSFALVSSQVQKPLYQTQTTPSGSSTTIYGGGGMNYPSTGPTAVPVTGVSTTTMLLLGVAAMVLLVMVKR